MIGAHDTTGDRRVGRYVLGERIGKGGMAEVFIGHAIGARGFRKPVAIKRLLATRAGDLDSIERLIGEAKLLVGLQHGNVVSVLDLVCEGDDVFVVMEYVDGPSVRQLLKLRGEQLPLIAETRAAGGTGGDGDVGGFGSGDLDLAGVPGDEAGLEGAGGGGGGAGFVAILSASRSIAGTLSPAAVLLP